MNRSQCLATMAICFCNMTYNHRLLKHIDNSKKLWNSKVLFSIRSTLISHPTSTHLIPPQSISIHINPSHSISTYLVPSHSIWNHRNPSHSISTCWCLAQSQHPPPLVFNPSQPISIHLNPSHFISSHLLMPCTVSTPSSSPLSLSLHNHSTRDATSCCLDIVVSKFS